MEISNLILHIESLIFASDKPLTSEEITELLNTTFGSEEDKLVVEQVEAALEGIIEKYSSEFYPFEVRQSGGGWQFLTKKIYHKTIAQLNGEKFLKRLSAAALETLAIIAYKQPITKGEIETIRGVSSDYTIQKLLEKDLIVITGRNEELPGHPLVYATSKSFMDYFGINSPEDLPKINDVLPTQVIEPTIVNHTEFEQGFSLAVSGEGELIDATSIDTSDTTDADNDSDTNGKDDKGFTGDEVIDQGNILDSSNTNLDESNNDNGDKDSNSDEDESSNSSADNTRED